MCFSFFVLFAGFSTSSNPADLIVKIKSLPSGKSQWPIKFLFGLLNQCVFSFLLSRLIVDDGIFFEPHKYYATNVIIGFARLNGNVIGIVANQPMVLAGCLDVNASDKATKFIECIQRFRQQVHDIFDKFNTNYKQHHNQHWLPHKFQVGENFGLCF